MSLTDKQKAFCHEYIKDHNATQAAIRAGYSAKTAQEQSSRLLSNVMVNQYISELLQETAKRNDLDTDSIVQELRLIAFSDLANLISIDPDTGTTRAKGWEEMPEGASRTVESIEEKRVIKESNDGESLIVTSTFKFKQYDKLKALEMLGKHIGMFRDKVELSVSDKPKPADIKASYTQINRMTDDEKLIYCTTRTFPDWLIKEIEDGQA